MTKNCHYYYDPDDTDKAIEIGFSMLFSTMFRGKSNVFGPSSRDFVEDETGNLRPMYVKTGEVDIRKNLKQPPGVLIAVNQSQDLVDIANRIRNLSPLKKLVGDEITGTATIHGIKAKLITDNIIPKYGSNMPLLALFPNPIFLSGLDAIPDIPDMTVICRNKEEIKEWIEIHNATMPRRVRDTDIDPKFRKFKLGP